MKNTLQKDIVLQALRALDHPTAEEAYAWIHKTFPGISKATVYRILGRLAEEGEITDIKVASGPAHYDWNAMKHYHILCIRCGKVRDVTMPELRGVEERVSDTAGFQILGYELVFMGICAECGGTEINQSGKEKDHG